MTDKIYRAGIIGCDKWGQALIKTINGMDGIQIGALCTTELENLKLCKGRVHHYTDYSELIYGNDSLDFIVIATPPDAHAEIIRSCIGTVKPFMVEKPLGVGAAQTKSLIDEIQRAKVNCMVGYNSLFNEAYQIVNRQNYKQKIKAIVTKLNTFGPFRSDISIFWDWLPNELAMVLASAEEMPEWVHGTYKEDPNYDNAGQVKVDLKFKNYMGRIEVNNVAETKYKVFQIDNAYSRLTMMDNEVYEVRDKVRPVTVGVDNPMRTLMESMILHIETGESFGLEISLHISILIDKIIESVKKGEPVMVKEVKS
jgi:predicted dehydrogenase